VLLRIVSHLQDWQTNNFNNAGLNSDWNLQLFLNMKERGMSVDKLHFASECTSAFQLIISLYNYSWRHSNCLSPAAAVLNKTNICTKLILNGNGKQLFWLGRWSIALQKHSKWPSITATAYQIMFYGAIPRNRSLQFVDEKHRYGS